MTNEDVCPTNGRSIVSVDRKEATNVETYKRTSEDACPTDIKNGRSIVPIDNETVAVEHNGMTSEDVCPTSNGNTNQIWQHENFDRIIRNEEEFIEKLQYIVNNPIKKGLADSPESYKWLYHIGMKKEDEYPSNKPHLYKPTKLCISSR